MTYTSLTDLRWEGLTELVPPPRHHLVSLLNKWCPSIPQQSFGLRQLLVVCPTRRVWMEAGGFPPTK